MNTTTKLAAATIAGFTALRIAKHIVRTNRTFDWRDKRVILTGGSRGLGLVIARQLVDQGARLTICSRNQSDLEVAAEELRQRGGSVLAVPCDVREREQVNSLVDRAVDEFDGVDVLINVAGIMTVGPLDSMTMDDFTDSMNTNCWVHCTCRERSCRSCENRAGGESLTSLRSVASERFRTCCPTRPASLLWSDFPTGCVPN